MVLGVCKFKYIKAVNKEWKGVYEMQVSKEHYDFGAYITTRRWMSYYYQIKEILQSKKHDSVLIIGKGDGVVPAVVKQLCEESQVDTFDFDAELKPTYVGDIRELNNIVKRKYDIVVCCQVLEHLEWQYFTDIIRQIREITAERAILSLPVHKFAVSITVDLPKFHHKTLKIVIPRVWKKSIKWNGEHYWEVGIKGHTRKNILAILNKQFVIKRHYYVPENTYHWFVIMDAS